MIRDCQHGFNRGKSCTSNLLEVLDHVGSLRDDGKQVNHAACCKSCTSSDLEATSCSGLALTLKGRYQRVTVLGETYDHLPVSSRVPQGSTWSKTSKRLEVHDFPLKNPSKTSGTSKPWRYRPVVGLQVV